MPIDVARVRQHLKAFTFTELFVEELGWDRHRALPLEIPVDGTPYQLQALAEKRGMVVYACTSNSHGMIPDHATRRKIEKETAKSAHEHLIIYLDAAKTTQVWQWVKREPGKPAACREHTFHKNQSGDALIQKLQSIAFDLAEEENLTIAHVAGRARQAFDIDRITKRFYDRFKTEHTAFLKFIKGIQAEADREWYASLMLNRLMFCYFIQRKGFLDGDHDYLRTKLRLMQERQNVGTKLASPFLTFYRHFLLRLFHEGLGQQTRSHELDALLGKVPYLNGGLFEVHELEQNNPKIEIPDQAFERIFDFFDAYQWHLDERPLRADNEINPDVLGYIFEKYINQKQMGAYYTKEDITEYISKNTVIPFLFDTAEKKCAIAFRPDGAVWGLLRENPDRYIYEAIRKGVDIPLPEEIAVGVQDISQRVGWNRPAAAEFALPTETWREHVARRTCCLELRAKLTAGEIHSITDLITYNLDIRQFAQDVIENCEGPELLRAFWHAIEQITILDPTCGSGAFLFAALNVLEPLYEACLERMQSFVDDLERSGEKHSPEKFSDFRKILNRVNLHPNRRYFILKSIIIGNLYGVDIMEEAVEICKLRLFLKLVAQVERVEDIEPLPDIDFNIRAGNTLVGFASLEDVKAALTRDPSGQLKLMDAQSTATLKRIEENAEIADRAFQQFREMQTEHGMDAKQFAEAKQTLRRRLDSLGDELDRYLANEYGIDPGRGGFETRPYKEWRTSHQPFHWFVEFYGIMKDSGFDVVISNPPWKEYGTVKKIYTVQNHVTESCGNLHGICTERALTLRSPGGWISFIVQLPLASSLRMSTVRNVLRQRSNSLFIIPFDDRPGKLFEGLEHCRSVIFLSHAPTGTSLDCLATARYQRWPTGARKHLFAQLEYARILGDPLYPGQFPKYANATEESLFRKIKSRGEHLVAAVLSRRETKYFIFYQEATQYWVKATVGLPYYAKNGVVGAPAHGRFLYFDRAEIAHAVCALLNSSLFYVYFIAYGDCFHLSDGLVSGFPIFPALLAGPALPELNKQLMVDLKANTERKTIRTRDGDEISYAEFYCSKSKSLIDEIDRILAKHYGFTDEELDFIINYDIKYRMGRDAGEDERG